MEIFVQKVINRFSIKNLKKIIKKYEKTLAFFVVMGYNISCLVQGDIKKVFYWIICARLAQLEEHLTLNQGVQGSSP